MTALNRRAAVAAVMAVASIGVTACGSSSKSKTSAKAQAAASTHATPTTPTKSTTASGSRFIAELNAACKDEHAASSAAPNTVAAQASIQHKNIERQSKLSPPANLRPVYAPYLSWLKQNVAAYERGDAAGTHKTSAELTSLEKELAAAGAHDCAPS
jgi:hypothetical protein